MDACTNPDVLRVIYFFLIILDIVKIIIPICLIIFGLIDFTKAVATNDEGVQKKSAKLFFKRILYAVLIFAVPWIIEVLIITLGNLSVLDSNEVNFTDCLENANADKIAELEGKIEEKETQQSQDKESGYVCYQCNGDKSIYLWSTSKPGINGSCSTGWQERKDLTRYECGSELCYYCPQTNDYYWGTSSATSTKHCPGSWQKIDRTEKNCKK